MTILVTGGAGYIGSVVSEVLIENGYDVIVLDNLVQGHLEYIHPKAKFIQGDVGDREILNKIFKEHKIEAVIHLAAYIEVAESVEKPEKYITNNFVKPLVLFDEMQKAGIKVIVISSTAAVYGMPEQIPIKEEHPTNPLSPYGLSKLMMEQTLAWYATKGLRYAALRYFNAAGATQDHGEKHNNESHLIPRLLQNLTGEINLITVNGDDYDTEDGTCIRDYIHVRDIAEAHLLILEKLMKETPSNSEFKVASHAYNIGNGKGFSIKEVISAVEEITGKKVNYKIGPRRSGDPSRLVASADKLRAAGWQPKHSDLKEIIESAWKWHTKV